MGVTIFDQWNSMAIHIPHVPVDYRFLNKCYLIIHDKNHEKRSHMSILIDIGGNSTDDNITGLLVHLVANLGDGECPHSTSIRHELWTSTYDNVGVIPLGRLSQSKYLMDQDAIPQYLTNPMVRSSLSLFYLEKSLFLIY